MVSRIINRLRINFAAIIIGIIVGLFSSVLTFALNSNQDDKKKLQIDLNEKATIIYVDKAFEHHREMSVLEDKRILNMEFQINEMHTILMRERN